MSRTAADEAPSLWPEQWATHVAVEADSIEHRTRIALATGPDDQDRQATARAIDELLTTARRAAERHGIWPWRGPFDRWRGSSVEGAYQSLHAARAFLVGLLPDAEVDALTPSVVARAATCLKSDDPRRVQIDALSAMPPGPPKRALLREATEITYDASDQLHMRVRGFRNILLSAALLITLLMIGLVFVVESHPDAMPLCFSPAITSPAQAATTTPELTTVCPSGDRQAPSGGDVMIVAGLGLLGGALAAAFAIRNIRGTATPYDIPIALALLKVPSGSLTAVAGILLLGGGFVPGLSELDSQRQILAYALLFGYAQQLGTRFIDDRAQSLLNSLPSKDPEAKQPQPSATPAPVSVPPAAAAETAPDATAAT
jgi:hypothetical protein